MIRLMQRRREAARVEPKYRTLHLVAVLEEIAGGRYEIRSSVAPTGERNDTISNVGAVNLHFPHAKGHPVLITSWDGDVVWKGDQVAFLREIREIAKKLPPYLS